MPTYAYACTECDHAMEVRQSFSDDALTTCPVCSGRLRKRFDSVGIVFKGSGFYRNDSRSGGSGGESTAPAKSDGGGSSSEGSSAGSSGGSSGGNGTGTSGNGTSGGSTAPAAPAPAKTPKAATPAS